MDSPTYLSTHSLSIGYTQGGVHKVVAQRLNLQLSAGQLTGLIGPNGVGKSTLIKTLAGFLPPLDGQISIMGNPLERLSLQKKSRLMSLVLPHPPASTHLRVGEIMALGRAPYTNWWGILQEEDQKHIQKALQLTGTESLLSRYLYQLSDGERQKVMIARSLAQDTPLVILDEPTAHLDVGSRMEIIALLRELAREQHKAILISTHDLEFALQLCDQLWLMSREEGLQVGCPEDLALAGSIGKVFDKDLVSFDSYTGNFYHQTPAFNTLAVTGDEPLLFWVKRVCRREGWAIGGGKEKIKISAFQMEKGILLQLDGPGFTEQFESFNQLITSLQKLNERKYKLESVN